MTKELKHLLRREYLRGLIDGQKTRLSKNYTVAILDKYYRKYTKANPLQSDILKLCPAHPDSI